MKKKVLVGLHAEIDIPLDWWQQRYPLEDKAKWMEEEAKDLTEFIRDHRSRDRYQIDIIREYEERCEFCGRAWEVDTDGSGRPVCCDKAIEEYEKMMAEKTKE